MVSVLMTAYNREEYIGAAMESVLASSYQDYELIVVDDGSSDKSFEIAQRYAGKDSRVRVHRNEKNLGDYPNRNRAAELATGKYLKYLDADDLIYPERLGVMVESMERFPDSGYGFTPAFQDDQRMAPFQLQPAEAYRRHYLRNKGVLGHSPLGAIINTRAFRQVGGFSGKRFVGDFELWHTLAARFPVVVLSEGGTWYRHHDNQESSHIWNSCAVQFEYKLVAFAQLMSPNCPLEAQEKDVVCGTIVKEEMKDIVREALRGNPGSAWRLFRKSNLGEYVRRRRVARRRH